MATFVTRTTRTGLRGTGRSRSRTQAAWRALGALTAALAALLAAPATLGDAAPTSVEGCLACAEPCDPAPCHQLALDLAAGGDYDRAIAIEEIVHARQPDNAQVAAALARMHHLGRKNTVRAIALYHAALGASSGYPPALFGLGTIMREKGEIEIAARYFARGVRERPDMPLFRVRLAEVLVDAGRGGEARPLLEEIVRTWPDSDEARAARRLMSRTALATP